MQALWLGSFAAGTLGRGSVWECAAMHSDSGLEKPCFQDVNFADIRPLNGSSMTVTLPRLKLKDSTPASPTWCWAGKCLSPRVWGQSRPTALLPDGKTCSSEINFTAGFRFDVGLESMILRLNIKSNYRQKLVIRNYRALAGICSKKGGPS